jgi:Domain of unknown function (DUF5679)
MAGRKRLQPQPHELPSWGQGAAYSKGRPPEPPGSAPGLDIGQATPGCGRMQVMDKTKTAEAEGMTAWCLKDRKQVVVKDVQALVMRNGKPASVGVCPLCGTKIFKIGAVR